jgi:adenylate cyclase
LARRRGHYLAEFDAAPQLRGALHLGPLVVGEMGDVKREIVLLGDTMNTTARIEEACRTTGCDTIASAALVRAAQPMPEDVRAESLGRFELRGKEGALELFALSRAPIPAAG